MKFLIGFSILILTLNSCQNSPEDISSLFRAAGVDLEIDHKGECLDKQLDLIYDQIGSAENKLELLALLEKKKITKVLASTVQEKAIECNQAIIDLNSPVSLRGCDPGTYSGTPKDLQNTQIHIADGEISLVVNAQELTKHFYVYASDVLLETELPDFEIQVQKSHKNLRYLSFDEITDISTQYGLSIKKLSHFPENHCGDFISLKDLMLRLSL